MPRTNKTHKTLYPAVVGLAALILVGGLIALKPHGTPLHWVIRGASLLGYLSVFLSIVSSAYMRELIRISGRPFIRAHHILSITGLILITLHPLAVAWEYANLRILLPTLDSWALFFQFGGQVVWPLIAVASLAAALRKAIGRNWRVAHYLNYVAFWLATVHAILIGTDFQYPVVKAISVVMSLATAAIFLQKRLRARKAK